MITSLRPSATRWVSSTNSPRKASFARVAVAYARRIVAEGKPLARIRDRDEMLESAKDNPQVFDDFRAANAKKFRGV